MEETDFGTNLEANAPVVEMAGVTKRYGDKVALDNATFTINKGEVFALLGPNGAGKTTLLRILTSIILPDSGTVRIMGTAGMEAVRSKVGYLPEERGLYKKQKVGEILAYIGTLKGLAPRVARERAQTVLDQVGMGAHYQSKTDTLSKGMAQRVQIASALVHDPPFLILDEPFSGLDPVSARQMHELILNEKARGRTVLLSTHQMEPVERLCDRLLMLNRGKTVLYGAISEIRARFAEGVVRVEHDRERLPDHLSLPPGTTLRNISQPHITDLTPPPGVSPGDLVRVLLEGGADIRAFRALSPGLEEIFVRVVGEGEK